MDLFENGIVKIDDIKYMARDVYGLLPKYCELKQIVLDFSYSSANVFSDITQLENPIFVTSVMVSSKSKGSKVYISASADNVENEKAFEVGNGDVLDCGALWRFIQLTGDNGGGDNVQLIVTGYELGYAFSPIPIEKYISGTSTLISSSFTFQLRLVGGVMTTYTAITDSNGNWRVDFQIGDKVDSMYQAFDGNTNVTSIDLHTMDFSECTNYDYAFRMCKFLEKIYGVENLVTSNCVNCRFMFNRCFSLKYDSNSPMDLSQWDTSNVTSMYYFMGSNSADRNTWIADTGNNAFYQCLAVNLPPIPSGCDTGYVYINHQGLQDVATCGAIGAVIGGIGFNHSTNLTLASAIVILSALQDLNGETATLTFANTTITLIQNDTTAMNLVAQAQSFGWTITGF